MNQIDDSTKLDISLNETFFLLGNAIDVYMAFEREEKRREKKQDMLDLEWLEWDKVQEVLAAEKEAKEQEAEEREAKEQEEWRKDPQGKEAQRKEAERKRRSAQVWEGAWLQGLSVKRLSARKSPRSFK